MKNDVKKKIKKKSLFRMNKCYPILHLFDFNLITI